MQIANRYYQLYFKVDVVIYLLFVDCAHGDIRLIGTSNHLAGYVEVCIDGVWGTVCDSYWGRSDAKVVCRQLGYSSSGKSFLMCMDNNY